MNSSTKTWASIVRDNTQTTCVDCNKHADKCKSCKKFAIFEDFLCGRCYLRTVDSEGMCPGFEQAYDQAEKIPIRCTTCRKKRSPHMFYMWEN